ncbi:MAG: serine/threonine-protein kinase [Nannocystaceae bacterium]
MAPAGPHESDQPGTTAPGREGLGPTGAERPAGAEHAGADTQRSVEATRGESEGPIGAVEQARAYDSLFKRSAQSQELGRYVVVDALGEGGMGVVLRAYDRQLDRTVALKVLRRTLDEGHARRLRREALAMAKLSHPNVVQVYEIGEVQGQTFVAMEFVKGQTVREWMNRSPPPGWRACVELFLQLGAGLAAAHEQGLVHRDFKPHNAMVDDKGRARVLDFGLARLGREEVEDGPSSTSHEDPRDTDPPAVPVGDPLTKTGAVLGTPAYMPLEQMRGRRVDARSDQFSFCVALYEALYAERPYEGRTMAHLLTSMHSGKVRPAPRGSDVPPALRKVLLRGLAEAPQQRWPSMEALLEALRRVAAPRRRRGTVVVVGAGLLALGVGLGATRTLEWLSRCSGARKQLQGVWDDARKQQVQQAIVGTGLSYAPATWERVRTRLDAYADAWAAEHTDACEATRSRDEQSEEEMGLRMRCLHQRWQHLRATIDEIEQADATVVERAVQAVTSLPGLERCRDVGALRAEVPPPEDPAVAERVAALDEVLVEAKAKQGAGKYEDGLRLADQVVAQAAALDYEPLMARAWQQQGRLRIDVGDYEGAVPVLRQAYRTAVVHSMTAEAADVSTALMRVLGDSLERHRQARGWAEHAEPLSWAAGTDEARSGFLHDLGAVAHSQGEYEEARDLYERALAIREASLGPDHPEVAAALNDLGSVAHSQGEYAEARALYERALVIFEQALGPDHPDVAASLDNQGRVANSQGKYEEARELHERALAILEQALGPEHPEVALLLINLGNVANSLAEHERARDLYERALAILDAALGAEHPKVASLLDSLGRVAHLQGKHDDARGFHEQSLAILEAALGPEHPQVASSLHGAGNVAHSQGRLDDARELYERALAIYERTLGPEHPKVATMLNNLGSGAHLQGKYDDARELYERALVIFEQALGPDHANVSSLVNNLADVAYSQGEYEDARALYERALVTFERALGPEHVRVAYPLTGLGEALLALGAAADAVPVLERALAIRTPHEVDSGDLAENRFLLARALWTAPAAQGRDRARARTLAIRARDAYAARGDATPQELSAVQTWLTRHRLR